MPSWCIKRQSMKIQSSLFHVHNRKRLTWKLILCGFEQCVLLNFNASAAEIGIYHGLKIVFLESTVHRLSVDALLVSQEDSPWRYKAVYSRCIIEKDWRESWYYAVSNLAFYWISRPCCRDLNLGRLKIVFLESTFLCLLSMPDSCIIRR
jgi:hypothetical protein